MDDKLKIKDDEIKEIRKNYLRDKYKFGTDNDIIKSFKLYLMKIILNINLTKIQKVFKFNIF